MTKAALVKNSGTIAKLCMYPSAPYCVPIRAHMQRRSPSQKQSTAYRPRWAVCPRSNVKVRSAI